MNGDGKIDIAIANTPYSRVIVLKNISSLLTIQFAAGVDYYSGVTLSPSSVLLGDIDGDKMTDLITYNDFGATYFRIYRKNLILPVTITSFSPNIATCYGTITVKGKGFSTNPLLNQVRVGTWTTYSHTSTDSTLTFVTPPGTPTSFIGVTNLEINSTGYSSQTLFSGCNGAKMAEAIVSETLSSELSVYPNPVKAGRSIMITTGSQQVKGWRLLNASGQLIKTSTQQKSPSSSFSIDTKGLKTGMYMLQIQTTAGTTNNKIVITD